MKKVLILTKTNWNEAPRIRHQITRLLKEKGYEVTFVEKNTYKSLFINTRREDEIEFFSHAELIHHQLRYIPIIQKANNFVVKHYLSKILRKIEFDFIFNFCYDYSFLKEIAPGKKIITMIEDDFESQAKFAMTRQIRNQVRKTCANSDHVLTVSYPLLNKIKTYNKNVTMLFPWSQRKYVAPKLGMKRNTVLYFGYVGRLDWDRIEELIKTTDYNYRFIGPTDKQKDENMVKNLLSQYKNFQYIQYSSIEALQLDDVFCSILPYNPNKKSVQMCTVSNRAFNLLSLGLPLAYADLKYLIEAPNTVIRKNRTTDEYKETLNFFYKNFYSAQKDIEVFLNDHYKEDRWKILNEVINE